MDRYNQNRLLNNYLNHQQNNVPFQNNALLQNNVMFRNSMSNNNSQQMRNIQFLQQQMRNISHAKDIAELEKISNNGSINKDDLIVSVIRPMKIHRTPEEQRQIDENYKNTKHNFIVERESWWKGRTNNPYKNIMKDENYKKKFEKQEDLIVHKVTDADKLQEVLFSKLDELKNDIEMHDKELKSIYSLSEKTKHLKKFDYDHVKKYERIKYNPADFNDMKVDRMEILKKAQKKMEGDKKKIDDVLNDLITKGFIDEVQKELTEDTDNNNQHVDNLNINTSNFEKELNEQHVNTKTTKTKQKQDDTFLEELNDLMTNDEKPKHQKANEIKSKPKKDKEITSKHEDKEIKKPRTVIKTIVKTKPKNESKLSSKSVDNPTAVSNDIKNKYRNRQKQSSNA